MADKRICLVNGSQIARKVLEPSNTKLNSFADETVRSFVRREARCTRDRIKIRRKIDHVFRRSNRTSSVSSPKEKQRNVQTGNPLISRWRVMKKEATGRKTRKKTTRYDKGSYAAKVLTAQTGSGWPRGTRTLILLTKIRWTEPTTSLSSCSHTHANTHTQTVSLSLIFSVLVLYRSSRTALKLNYADRVFERSGSFPSPSLFQRQLRIEKAHDFETCDSPSILKHPKSLFRLILSSTKNDDLRVRWKSLAIYPVRVGVLGATVKYP